MNNAYGRRLFADVICHTTCSFWNIVFPTLFLHLKPHFRALRDVAIEVELQRYSKLKAAVLAASNQKELEEVKVPEGFWWLRGNGGEVMIIM